MCVNLNTCVFAIMLRSIITGTGSYIPTETINNSSFVHKQFFGEDELPIKGSGDVIVSKFEKITGIAQRKYVSGDLNASDIASYAAIKAINDSKIEKEELDLLIVAHNFGDVSSNSVQSDMVPSLASRVKHALGIKNPACVAYDLLFGCPGWILGLTQADAYFKAGIAKKALIIGTETLSRVIDIYDRDSMIFSDGAGAVVLESRLDNMQNGIRSSATVSHSIDETFFIQMGNSYNPHLKQCTKYIKMKGRKVYEYALTYVPQAMKDCLDKSGVGISQLKKIFIHQANEKMDEAIVDAFYKLYGIEQPPAGIMPMCIHYLGNSSVATVPTLFDLVRKGCDEGHSLHENDIILFASVGAGMNINAVCYQYI